jgi:hypothetical protein
MKLSKKKKKQKTSKAWFEHSLNINTWFWKEKKRKNAPCQFFIKTINLDIRNDRTWTG